MSRQRDPDNGARSTPRLCRNARGYAFCKLDGRQHWFGRYDDPATHTAFAEFIKRWQANGQQAPIDAAGSGRTLTVADVVAEYLQHAATYYVKDGQPTGELQNIREALLHELVDLFGSTPAAELGPKRLALVRDAMIGAGSKKAAADGSVQRLSRRTVNGRVARIKRCWRWAAAQELIPGSAFHGLAALESLRAGRSAARETRPVEPVDWQHVEPVLEHVSAEVCAMILLCWHSGMRPNEVVQIRGVDIDRSRADGVWLYRPRRSKVEHFGIERIIPIGPKGQEALAGFLRVSPDEPLFQPRAAEKRRSLFRRAARVSPMTPSQLARRGKLSRKRPPGTTYSTEALRKAIERGIDTENTARRKAVACRVLTSELGEAAREWIEAAVGRARMPARGSASKRSREMAERILRNVERRSPSPITPAVRTNVLCAIDETELVPTWTTAQLRHSAATRLRRGVGLDGARTVLGHTTPATTAIYAARDLESAIAAMRLHG